MRHGARRALLVFLFALCLLGLAGSLSAGAREVRRDAAANWAASEESGEQKHAAVFKWINFILLAGALVYLLRKPLAEFFTRRSASIQKSLEEGRKALEASQAQLQAVEEKLQRFEEEMAAFRADALREMEAERERLRQATAQEAAKMIDSVRLQMETASKQAQLELRLYAAEQAVKLAEQMIGRRLDDTSQRRLLSHFIAGLEATRTGS